MKQLLLCLSLIAVFAACQQDQNQPQLSGNNLQLLTTANPEWEYKNLRIYPIIADAAAITANNTVGAYKTMAEAMEMPGFRVTERRKFGRSEDSWYRGLTVQNKTQDTVYIMSGDVVKGGNQDRVFAHEDVVLPGTVKNLEVFCVEQGRSHYYNESASQEEKQVAAFKGYFNVASPQVRQAIQRSGDQNEVWSAVGKVTSANGAESSTRAYTALDNESEEKAKRDAYLRFFEGKMQEQANVVGMVVVCGDRVLGVDIFGQSDLFKRQYAALLHGYVAEAGTAEAKVNVAEEVVQNHFQQVARLSAANASPTPESGKFVRNGKWVHLYSK